MILLRGVQSAMQIFLARGRIFWPKVNENFANHHFGKIDCLRQCGSTSFGLWAILQLTDQFSGEFAQTDK